MAQGSTQAGNGTTQSRFSARTVALGTHPAPETVLESGERASSTERAGLEECAEDDARGRDRLIIQAGALQSGHQQTRCHRLGSGLD